MRVHQQPSYVLLNRPYSETSWIVEVFSRDFGRLALMAKGARRIKSKLKGTLLPFQPLLLSWTGKGEIPTLTSAEIDQADFNLIEHELLGDDLVCGFYCNELMVNLLHRHDPHKSLFDHYHSTIMSLARSKLDSSSAQVLREFEKTVMKETGYEVNFHFEAGGQTPINAQDFYRYQSNQGFVRTPGSQHAAFSGRVIQLLALGFNDSSPSLNSMGAFTNQEVSQAKQLMRDILSQTLGYKQIVSRELFYPKNR